MIRKAHKFSTIKAKQHQILLVMTKSKYYI